MKGNAETKHTQPGSVDAAAIERLEKIGMGRVEVSLRIPQAMEILNVSRASIYRLLAERELVAFKIGQSRRITLSSVRNFQDRQIAKFIEGEDFL